MPPEGGGGGDAGGGDEGGVGDGAAGLGLGVGDAAGLVAGGVVSGVGDGETELSPALGGGAGVGERRPPDVLGVPRPAELASPVGADASELVCANVVAGSDEKTSAAKRPIVMFFLTSLSPLLGVLIVLDFSYFEVLPPNTNDRTTKKPGSKKPGEDSAIQFEAHRGPNDHVSIMTVLYSLSTEAYPQALELF